jgi:hypothetical protein
MSFAVLRGARFLRLAFIGSARLLVFARWRHAGMIVRRGNIVGGLAFFDWCGNCLPRRTDQAHKQKNWPGR